MRVPTIAVASFDGVTALVVGLIWSPGTAPLLQLTSSRYDRRIPGAHAVTARLLPSSSFDLSSATILLATLYRALLPGVLYLLDGGAGRGGARAVAR